MILALLMGCIPTGFAVRNYEAEEIVMTDESTGKEGSYKIVSLNIFGADYFSDVPAILNEDDRTMVPIRLVEQLGAKVGWTQDTQTAHVTLGDKVIDLPIGNPYARVNGKNVLMPSEVPAKLYTYDGITRTMVPVRFITEMLGFEIFWQQETLTVAITKMNQTINDVTFRLDSNYPEIRFGVTGDIDATGYRVIGSDVGNDDKIVLNLQNVNFNPSSVDFDVSTMFGGGVKTDQGVTTFKPGIFGMDQVSISEVAGSPKTTRVEIDLSRRKGFDVSYDASKGEFVIRLINNIEKISVEKIYTADTVVVQTAEDPTFDLKQIGNQVVVDIIGATVGLNDGKYTVVPVDQGKIANYSYSKYDVSKDTTGIFEGFEEVGRVAVTLADDATMDDVYVEAIDNKVYIYVSGNPLNGFNYAKVERAKSQLQLNFNASYNYSTSYNSSSRELSIRFPIQSLAIEELDVLIDDNIVSTIDITKSGSEYLATLTLENGVEYTELTNGAGSMAMFNFVNKNMIDSQYSKYLVVVDAGHGGYDPGAIGSVTQEKDLALNASLKLKKALELEGFKVYMTREEDVFVGLRDRAEIANSLNADVFVSVHMNSFTNPSANGIETLYASDSLSGGYGLAKEVQGELMDAISAKNRGVIKRPLLAVLRYTNMPAVLVELGFVSNPNEEAKLRTDSYMDTAASAIVRGIKQFVD